MFLCVSSKTYGGKLHLIHLNRIGYRFFPTQSLRLVCLGLRREKWYDKNITTATKWIDNIDDDGDDDEDDDADDDDDLRFEWLYEFCALKCISICERASSMTITYCTSFDSLCLRCFPIVFLSMLAQIPHPLLMNNRHLQSYARYAYLNNSKCVCRQTFNDILFVYTKTFCIFALFGCAF